MNPRTYFTPVNGYNPRYGARDAKASVKSFKYSVDDVWAAAVAAQRVNGAYLKEALTKWNEEAQVQEIVKERNRDVMMNFLLVPGTITDEDRKTGRECRKFLQNDLTFRALKGRLTDFDQSMSRVVAVEEEFDTVLHRLELAIVACLPQSHQRALARAGADEKLAQCKTIDAKINDKVTLVLEVIRSNYSQQYGIHWITAVTADQCAVFFSFKENFDAGTTITVTGTVKAQRDGKTQLNRVKVL